MKIRAIYNRILSKPAIVSAISILALWFGATAGSLTPPTGVISGTMYTLAQIFNPLASGSYDSSGINAEQNGSLFENIKYIESQLGWASSSNNLYYLGSGNVGIGDSSPETKFEVVGAASVSQLYIGGSLISSFGVSSDSLDFDEFVDSMTLDANTTIASGGYGFNFRDTEVEFGGVASIGGDIVRNLLINTSGTAGFGPSIGFTQGGTERFFIFNPVGTSDLNLGASFPGQLILKGLSGNVGVNSTLPPARFTVFDGAAAFISAEIYTDRALQVGASATVSYSRFGTGATSYGLSASQDLLLSSLLEVDGQAYFDSHVSVSGNFELFGLVSSNLTPTITNTYSLGTSALRWANVFASNASISGSLEVVGYASVSQLYVGGSLFSGVSVGSDSLDFDEFVDSMTLDANTTIASGGFLLTIGQASISEDLEVMGKMALGNNAGINGGPFIEEFYGEEVPSLFAIDHEVTEATSVGLSSYYRLNPDTDMESFTAMDIFTDIDTANTQDFSNANLKVLNVRFDPQAPFAGAISELVGQTISLLVPSTATTDDTTGLNLSVVTYGADSTAQTTGAQVQVFGSGAHDVIYGVSATARPDNVGTANLAAAFRANMEAASSYGPGLGRAVGFLVNGDSGIVEGSSKGYAFYSDGYEFSYLRGNVGIGTSDPRSKLEVAGVASISGVLYAHGGCVGCGGGGGVGSDSLDFDEFEPSLILDENTEILFNGFEYEWQMGFGAFRVTTIETDPMFEITRGSVFAGAEYTIDGVLQVGSVATASYSRFGSGTTSHALGSQDNLLISGPLEVNGVLYADGGCVGCGGGVTSNSLDFDEFVNAMTLDANTSIANGGFVLTVQGASLSGNLGPSATNTYDLGSQALRWRSIYVSSGSIHMGMQGNESIIDYDTTAEAEDFLAFKPDGSTTTFRMYDSGNASVSGNFEVGGTLIANSISISSISGNLEITGYASASQYFGGGLTDCDVAGTSKLLWDATTGRFSCGTDSGSSTAGWTDDGTVVRLTTSTDNVGIGTSTVNQKLEVAGVASVSGNIIVNNTTGNVGIGTSTPGARFDVMGGSGSAADLVNIASSTGTLVFQINNDGLAKLTRTLVLGGGNISTTDLFQQINDDTANNSPTRSEIASSIDLFIEGDFEVDGIVDFGSSASVTGNVEAAGGYFKATSTGGTTLTPNFTFSLDDDTGLGNAYNNAPNRLFFFTNGAARGFFDSSGNLVLNSTSVYNTAGGAAMLDVTGTAGANDIVRFASISGAEAMVIGPNRALVIGGGAYRALDADFNQISTDTTNTEPERSELTATDDLYIAGDLEIEGILDIGGNASFSANIEMNTLGTRLILPDYVVAVDLDTPVLVFNNDRDTGIAHEGTNAPNKLYFVTAGNASGLFDASGNFVLDNTADRLTVGTAKLDVTGTAGANNIAIFASSSAARALIIGPNRAVTIGGGNYAATDDFTQINDDTTNNSPDRSEIDQLSDLYISDDLEIEGILDIGTHASIGANLEVAGTRIKVAQGNIAAETPNYTWSDDPDTGFSTDFQDPNQLYVVTGGVMRSMWDDDGDFLVGGTYTINLEPVARLTVRGKSGANELVRFSSSSDTTAFLIGPNNALTIGGGAYAAADDFHQIVTNSGTENPERTEISGLNDLFIGGDLEVDGTFDVSAEASVGGAFEITSGYLKIPDGTAALPSLRFQGSPTTGLFEAAADIFGFATAGVERMRINASGNVAVGTTTTTNFFTIMGDVATLFEVASGSNEWLTVLEAGNVGIGDNTPTTTLDVAGNASVSGNLEVGGFVKTGDGTAAAPAKTFSSDPDTGFFSGGANILAVSTGGTERGRFTNTGLGLGTSAISVRLEIVGTASASYLFAQNSFQVANTATVSYSRLGSGATGHSLDAGNDLLISDDLEVDGEIFADGGMTMGNTLNLNSNDITNVDSITANSFVGGSFSGSGLSVSGGVSGSGASFSGNIEVGGVAKLSNGSAGAPAYTFTGAMTTGMYNAGGTLAFSVGGAQRATITSGGLVNAIVGFSVNGTAGQDSDCASNEFLGNMTVTGGIVTAGSCETDDVDYAERFYAGESSIEPGDIVVANPSGPIDIGIENAQFNQAVVKSTDAYQNSIIGVISTMPGLVIGAKGTPENPAVEVALAGRVPVRVLTTNGHIKVGDRITSSDVPGAGMKAVSAGMVVGMALESTNLVASGSEQTIMVFLQPGYWAPSVAEATQGVDLALEGQDSGLFASILSQFASLLNIEFGDSSVKADRIRAKSVELEGDNGDIHCVRIVGGELQSAEGACDEQAAATSEPVVDSGSPDEPGGNPEPEPTSEESPDTEQGDASSATETSSESEPTPSDTEVNGSPDEPFTELTPRRRGTRAIA